MQFNMDQQNASFSAGQRGRVRLLIATRNAHKFGEMCQILASFPRACLLSAAEFPNLPDPEETGATFLENATLKACYYAERTGLLSLADDSGLVIDALDGRPGVFSSRYGTSDADRIARVLREMEHVPEGRRTARFMCAMVLAGPQGLIAATEGTIEGSVAREPRGNSGFGYDPIFHVAELGCHLAEVSAEAKNQISHRGRALGKMIPVLIQSMGLAKNN